MSTRRRAVVSLHSCGAVVNFDLPTLVPAPKPSIISPGLGAAGEFTNPSTTTQSTQAVGFSNLTINTTSESIVSFLFPPHEIPTDLNFYGLERTLLPCKLSMQLICAQRCAMYSCCCLHHCVRYSR